MMDYRIEIVRQNPDYQQVGPPHDLPKGEPTVREVFRVSAQDFAEFMATLDLGTLLKMAVKRDDATPWTPN